MEVRKCICGEEIVDDRINYCGPCQQMVSVTAKRIKEISEELGISFPEWENNCRGGSLLDLLTIEEAKRLVVATQRSKHFPFPVIFKSCLSIDEFRKLIGLRKEKTLYHWIEEGIIKSVSKKVGDIVISMNEALKWFTYLKRYPLLYKVIADYDFWLELKGEINTIAYKEFEVSLSKNSALLGIFSIEDLKILLDSNGYLKLKEYLTVNEFVRLIKGKYSKRAVWKYMQKGVIKFVPLKKIRNKVIPIREALKWFIFFREAISIPEASKIVATLTSKMTDEKRRELGIAKVSPKKLYRGLRNAIYEKKNFPSFINPFNNCQRIIWRSQLNKVLDVARLRRGVNEITAANLARNIGMYKTSFYSLLVKKKGLVNFRRTASGKIFIKKQDAILFAQKILKNPEEILSKHHPDFSKRVREKTQQFLNLI